MCAIYDQNTKRVGKKEHREKGWVRLDYRGKKIFFTSQFYHSIRCFLRWKFLTDDVDCRASANFMVPTFFRDWLPLQHSYEGCRSVIMPEQRYFLPKKIQTPLRIVPMSQYPGLEDYVPFSGNYLSWHWTWYPHATSLKIKNRIVGKTKKNQKNPPTTPFLRRDRCGGQ